ncbi:MAG: MerR family transcriptional regulator [Raoultibacter sp.]
MTHIIDNQPNTEAKQLPQYSIREVVESVGISAYTLRYYDKCGFFPYLYRDKNNIRSFSDADIDQLHLVDALRKSGLSIEGIQYYVKLDGEGTKTEQERLSLLQDRQTVLEYQLLEVQESLKILEKEGLAIAMHLKAPDTAFDR